MARFFRSTRFMLIGRYSPEDQRPEAPRRGNFVTKERVGELLEMGMHLRPV